MKKINLTKNVAIIVLLLLCFMFYAYGFMKQQMAEDMLFQNKYLYEELQKKDAQIRELKNELEQLHDSDR